MANADKNKIMSEIADLEDDYVAFKKKCTALKEQYVDENNQTISFTVFAKQEELGTFLKRAQKIKLDARKFLMKSMNEFNSIFDRIDDLESDIYHSYEVKNHHSDR